MSNNRILKKKHTRFLADFLIEASQDEAWVAKLKELNLEDRLDTAAIGYPELFTGFFPEVQDFALEYSIERINYADIPRKASAWWPVDEHTSYFMAYPTAYPQTAIYLAIDLEHSHEH